MGNRFLLNLSQFGSRRRNIDFCELQLRLLMACDVMVRNVFDSMFCTFGVSVWGGFFLDLLYRFLTPQMQRGPSRAPLLLTGATRKQDGLASWGARSRALSADERGAVTVIAISLAVFRASQGAAKQGAALHIILIGEFQINAARRSVGELRFGVQSRNAA